MIKNDLAFAKIKIDHHSSDRTRLDWIKQSWINLNESEVWTRKEAKTLSLGELLSFNSFNSRLDLDYQNIHNAYAWFQFQKD